MRDKVKEGYEKGDYKGDYRENRRLRSEEKELFQKLFTQIKGEKILDLGCGMGIPFDKYLTEQKYRLTGVDIAGKHIHEAKKNVPNAEFIQGEFFEMDFSENSFDAIVSFYAIFHIPREEHSKLLEKMRYWVKEDGAILITLGADVEMDGLKGEIGGEEMVWSAYAPEENKKLVKEAGFEILDAYTENWREEKHFWILAKPMR